MNNILMSSTEVILDEHLMELGFKFIAFFNGLYIYYTNDVAFEINRTGGITGSHFIIYKNATKVFDGNVPNLRFLEILLLNTGAIQKTIEPEHSNINL